MKSLIGLGLFLSVVGYAAQGETILLDVRTQDEWKEKHLTNEVYDFKDPGFKEKISKLDRTKHYQLFCRSGNRSGQAVKVMKEMGFSQVESVGSLEDAQAKTGKSCVGPACAK